LAAGGRSVWVFSEGAGTVQRIDGKDSKLLATIETDAVGTGSITVGGGFVWVSTRLMPLIQIDPRTNSVRGKSNFAEMSEYSTIAYAGGRSGYLGSSVRDRERHQDASERREGHSESRCDGRHRQRHGAAGEKGDGGGGGEGGVTVGAGPSLLPRSQAPTRTISETRTPGSAFNHEDTASIGPKGGIR
jgi:hypothetical protein